MKETANRYTIALLSVLMVCLLAAPAMGCTCSVSTSGVDSFGTNGTVNGTVYVGGDNHPDDSRGDEFIYSSEFDVPNGTIKWARVYWHIWGGTYYDYGWSNATFCNDTGGTSTNNRYISDSNCNQTDYDGWYKGGCGTHWLYWNVTDNVSVGHNNLTIDNSGGASWDGRVMYMVLVVVLDNMTGYPATNYWINQGYMDTGDGDQHTTWFDGPINNTSNLTLWHLALCSNGNMSIWFNETLVKNYPYGTGFGSDAPEPTSEIIDKSWANTTSQAQNMTWENIDDAWFHPVMAILIDYTPPADLIVTGITDPDPLRPDNDSTVTATIKNVGSEDIENKFNVSLYIDGDWNDTKNVSSLGAGKSTTVSFEKVNESYGCHSFRVFVDSDGNVSELNEGNNNMTEDMQVGYVIVVESDSDFEKLNTSKSAALPSGCFKNESGTYYIQNLTIENCAGMGITIKNTNKKFVINNCTIENCTDSGVFFHNLKNGTINGSTVQNNTKYGIEVGLVSLGSDDPEFVDITNNTIDKNLYGIELIGFNCTVSNNIITNNTKYGIYMLADDTNITDGNIIRNNTDYGVMLYNSSRNYIYCNTFTDNNASSPGHQACDNGNTNHWNTTDAGENYTGNRWKDWDDNSGYPCNYTIDCGSNADKRPKGLYDFLTGDGEDKWAFRSEVANRPPNTCDLPSNVFTTDPDEYANIKTDNGEYKVDETGTVNYYAAHRFNFSISEDPDDISKINVTWNGKGLHDNGDGANGAYLYIWNGTGYEELANNGVGTDATLTGENESSASSYINGGNVTVLVVQKSAYLQKANRKSQIETDYVRVAIVDP